MIQVYRYETEVDYFPVTAHPHDVTFLFHFLFQNSSGRFVTYYTTSQRALPYSDLIEPHHSPD